VIKEVPEHERAGSCDTTEREIENGLQRKRYTYGSTTQKTKTHNVGAIATQHTAEIFLYVIVETEHFLLLQRVLMCC